MKFVEIGYDLYIRQIKKHLFSKWKTCVDKKTKQPLIFTKKELDSYWAGKATECINLGIDGNQDKWTKYDLI